ncbi:38676_t:CDS:2, partial [Gigaspora margarita]
NAANRKPDIGFQWSFGILHAVYEQNFNYIMQHHFFVASNNWKDLNNIWTRVFLKVTEELLDQGTFIEMKGKVIEEHSQHAKEFEKYWRSIIDEQKDVWVVAEVNIHDNLTPLDRSICFLDGHALEDVIEEPDFIVVDENYDVKRNIEKEGLRITKALPSTTQSTKFTGTYVPMNYDPISNTSTDPTLFNSITYIIFISNSRYAPYIDKPKMITDEEPSNSGTSDNEQNDDKEFKYKKKLSLKESNVATRSQSTQIELLYIGLQQQLIYLRNYKNSILKEIYYALYICDLEEFNDFKLSEDYVIVFIN